MASLIVGMLVAWFVLSVVGQFWTNGWVTRLKTLDMFELIPGWTFFAPNPGVADTELLYRDQLIDGQLTPWMAVTFEQPSVWRAVWNPGKRRRKAIIDLGSILVTSAQSAELQGKLVLTVPYIALLAYVCALPLSPLTHLRQFILAHSFGDSGREPEILFISGFHRP